MSASTAARVTGMVHPPRSSPPQAAAPPPSALAGRRIHFAGIGGCGMSGLARMVRQAGAVCTGSDLAGSQAIAPYLYPPPTFALSRLFARLPYPAAQVPWCALQFLLGLGALALLLAATGVRWDKRYQPSYLYLPQLA